MWFNVYYSTTSITGFINNLKLWLVQVGQKKVTEDTLSWINYWLIWFRSSKQRIETKILILFYFFAHSVHLKHAFPPSMHNSALRNHRQKLYLWFNKIVKKTTLKICRKELLVAVLPLKWHWGTIRIITKYKTETLKNVMLYCVLS